jgi:ribosomal protein L11 methyltransferase
MKTWPALAVMFPDPGASAPDTEGLSLGDAVQAALVDRSVTAITARPAETDAWTVFFATGVARDHARRDLLAQFGRRHLRVVAEDVADEDWAARSQAALRAITVGGLVIAPPWDVPPAGLTVVIQPSMGFGTGHHATTRLCLAALQRLDLRSRHVLDVGTGSGVLAIAAAKLGAQRVLGIDDDEDAIASARDNLALNPGVDVTLGAVDLRKAQLRPVDLVLANLTGSLLVSAAPILTTLSCDRLVLSGFLLTEATDVLAAYPGWRVDHEGGEDEWGSVILGSPAT